VSGPLRFVENLYTGCCLNNLIKKAISQPLIYQGECCSKDLFSFLLPGAPLIAYYDKKNYKLAATHYDMAMKLGI